MSTTNQKMILNGCPQAWFHLITEGTITEKWRFDNIQKAGYKILKTGSNTTNANNLDIKRIDGATWRFPKETLILDGITENDITPADASSDATGKAEITMIIVEAPIEKNSFTAFAREFKTLKDSLFLVTIPSGQSYRAKTDQKKPEGYIHMIGKISSDSEFQFEGEKETSLSLTLVSYKNSGLVAADLTDESLFTAITWKKGGTGKDITGIKPPTITSGDAAEILAGDVVIVSDIVYS
jgi:hypothetical protein